jgi:hypothetical protein
LRARVDGGKDLITQLEGFIQFLQGAIKELPDTKEITAATPGLSPFNKAIAPSNFSAHVELPENSALKSKAKAPRNLMQNVEEYLKSENH